MLSLQTEQSNIIFPFNFNFNMIDNFNNLKKNFINKFKTTNQTFEIKKDLFTLLNIIEHTSYKDSNLTLSEKENVLNNINNLSNTIFDILEQFENNQQNLSTDEEEIYNLLLNIEIELSSLEGSLI
jgi:hypothetical protein